MGRKIPGKKHRGVKDPDKQRVKRLAELELCTNTAPKNPDEQAIPKSLERVIKLKEAAKNSRNTLKKKRKKKNALICVGLQDHKLKHPKAKPEKVTPVFQQRPGESGRQFMHRVTKDTHNFLKEIEFEKKYGVQVERDSNTGRIQGLTKCKREKDDVEILQAKHKNIGKKKKITEGSTALTKYDKQKLKQRIKKERKQENCDEFERFQDKVVFGEVAHEPPRLKIKSKEMDGNRKPRNLLLNSLLEGSKDVSSGSNVINRSRKRKYLSEIERKKLEKRQNEVIAAYRQLKSQRLINKSC
ncbi:hypothetical protein PUN28_009059 [Cardiocondyla obscurior]|uniref:Coiled-coil domain-containing protein 137 n=1 Tax=Cardiocondyla obscurior TaxID=286306 RepID=A0AAW2FTK9_9HYME